MSEGFDLLVLTLAATLRVATPLIFCAMGGLFSERSGIIDVGLEGKMLMAAFAAGTVAAVTDSAWLAIAAAILASTAMALLHGFACITWRGNQVVSGVAINIIAAGLTVVLGTAFFQRGGQTPALEPEARLMPITLPGVESLASVPVLGPIYRSLISGQNVLVYLALLSVPLTWWIVSKTRFGLRLRAVGEMPLAVDSAGISVAWLRYRAVLLCGLFAGIAVSLMGRNHPLGIALAALLFGALQQGGAELSFEIPAMTREMVVVIQGLVILFSGALANLTRPWFESLFAALVRAERPAATVPGKA